jgi:hypothetical protein
VPSPSSSRRALSRRTTLLGAVALGTAACTPYSLGEDQRQAGEPKAPPASREPRTDPDVPLAAAVLAAEQDLVDRIDATVAAHPRLERVLAATREIHTAHVDLLADAAPESPSPSAAARGSGTPSPSAAAEPGRVSRDPGRALQALARHEDELSLADKRSAFAAESGSFARVLGSMAAAAAQQAAVLRTTAVPGRRR